MDPDSIQLLRNMPVFGGLSPEVLQRIVDGSSRCPKSKGEYFFLTGDAAKSLFVLQSGQVVIEKEWNGNSIAMHRLKKGDCFGEMSLIDLQARSASVRAETDCETIEISLQMLHALYRDDVEQYAIMMMNMGREVSRRLRKTSQQLFEMEQRN